MLRKNLGFLHCLPSIGSGNCQAFVKVPSARPVLSHQIDRIRSSCQDFSHLASEVPPPVELAVSRLGLLRLQL